MELGNFLGKLKGENKEEPQKFLALILTDEVVQAAVWHVVNEKTEIIATGTPVEWDGDTGTTNELITSVDATISSAVEGLSDEPNSVLLGIPHSWTDKDGILGVKKEFISKIRKELDLQAVGYVVITDSILSYLKMQEGTPTTSILIQVSRDELILALVRLGRIEAIETIGRSDDIVDDVTEGVARFKVADNLPSRIILFNSMHNLDEIIQNLLSVDWQAQFNFLHTPKIESLAKDIAIKALVVGGGSEVAKSLGFTLADNPLPEPEEAEIVESSESSSSSPVESDDNLLGAEDFGFSSTAQVVAPVIEAEKLKFVDSEDEPEFVSEEPEEEVVMPKTTPKKSFTMPTIALPAFKMPKLKLNISGVKSHWWMIGGGVLALGLLIFYLIWFVPKAVITVSVTPKSLDKSVDITLSTKEASIDFADKIVPAQVETVSESGEKTIDTTGTKTIGDPAKGAVTIYNRTSSAKTFAKDTVLNSGSLKFTIDSDVTVASGAASNDYVGKASASITASAIGTDSNLSSGKEFTIASFGKDSYVAKNDAALSGGTSQEVQVVSKDDQSNLSKTLTDELIKTLETKAKSSSTPGTAVYVIPDSAKIEEATYSQKVGETSKALTGNITIKVTLLRYKTDDVTTLVNSEIDGSVPAGYVRAGLPSTVDLSASEVSEDESEVKGSAKVSVALLPVIDESMVKSVIKGKSASLIESRLMSAIPGYSSAVVEFTPRWYPTKLKGIPRNPQSITIKLNPTQ
jgi:hypothetical protein